MAGFVDAGAASAGTFFIGLFAAATLSAAQLGTYAVIFGAFLAGTVVPSSLWFWPVEAEAVEASGSEPIGWYLRSIVTGIPICVAGALGAGALAVVAIPTAIPGAVLVAVGAATVLSPIQDHGRQLLHLSRRSWWAALTSVQFTALVAALLLLVEPSSQDTLVFLFGTLALANFVSVLTPLALAIRHRATAALSLWPVAIRRGLWLFGAAMLPALAAYGTQSLVANVASFADAGYAEAARVVVAPILVAHTGVVSVLRADLFRQGLGRTSRRWDLIAIAITGTLAVAWGAVLVFGPTSDLVAELVPNAYVVPGLLALTLGAALLFAVASVLDNVALGARQEPTILGAQTVASVTRLVVAAPLAALAGAVAQPVSAIAATVGRLGYLRYFLRRHRVEREER